MTRGSASLHPSSNCSTIPGTCECPALSRSSEPSCSHFQPFLNRVWFFRDKVLVCPMKSAPVLLTLSDSKHVVLPVDDDSDLNVVAAFDRRGEYIYTGNAKGKVRPRRAVRSLAFSGPDSECDAARGHFQVKVVTIMFDVSDSGVKHKHSGARGFLQSYNRHQQHHSHQIHRICTKRKVRCRRSSF